MTRYLQPETQQKAVRGKHPCDPGMLPGCVIPSLSRPARPRPQPGGCSPWLWSGHPRGLPPTPRRAPTQAARPPHRQPLRSSRRPSRPGSVYKRLLAVPLSNASPRQPGSQTLTHRVPAREDRPLLREEQGGRAWPDLLISLFATQSLSKALSPPRSSQRRKGCLHLKLSLGTYWDRASCQQLSDVTTSAQEAGGGAAELGADSELPAAKAAEPTSGDEFG